LAALAPVLEQIGSLTERIRQYDRRLETIAKEHYPETELLRQVEGVGPLTALTFVLSLEDPYRFERSRSVGAYLGLVPARDRSGERDPQKKRISKEGDEMLSVGSSGKRRPLHPRSVRIGLGPQAPRAEDSLTRGQERKETGGGGRGKEALCATTQLVDQRGGLRATAQRPPLFWSPGSLKEGAKPKSSRRR
jgi:hypothetical protein